MDAVKVAAARSGMMTTRIGPAMGKAGSYVSAIASRGSTPKADTLAAMLEACGWRLVAVPRASVPPDGLVIDPAGR